MVRFRSNSLALPAQGCVVHLKAFIAELTRRVASMHRESESTYSRKLLNIRYGFLGVQSNFHHLLAFFHSLSFRKIEVPENVQHTLVLPLYKRVKGPNPVTSCCVEQPMSQACSYSVALPSILNQRRVLGSLVTWFAGIAHHGDDLVWVFGI